jgi:hypothetical protein
MTGKQRMIERTNQLCKTDAAIAAAWHLRGASLLFVGALLAVVAASCAPSGAATQPAASERAQESPRASSKEAAAGEETVANVVAVGRVWSGHPVGFDLLTKGGHQYVAYYDATRQLTVAHRRAGHPGWRYAKLDSYVGWDSHNSIEMALDSEGHLHLSGNMHVDPLVYFRTTEPHDVRTLRRVETMADESVEARATYPEFFRNKEGRLIFKYRSGKSGDGNEIYNIYDAESQTWRPLTEAPLTDGEDERNAYFDGPVLGPDGKWHLAWVWRESPDAATNHDLSYAVSDDLKSWQTSTGEPFSLPITLDEAQVVDPVPVQDGLLNGLAKVGFDHAGRATITYHKYDEDGDSQIYVARAEDGGAWQTYRISDWSGFRWDFGGGGSLPESKVGVGRVEPAGEGRLAVDVYRKGRGWKTWTLDAETLEKVGERPRQTAGLPQGVQRKPEVQVDRAGAQMQMNYARDSRLANSKTRGIGRERQLGVRYLLSWATLGQNRDYARAFIPPPTTLRLYRLTRTTPSASNAAGDAAANATPNNEPSK